MRTLKENERLVQIGSLGRRSPTGEVIETVPLYEIVTVEPGAADLALSPGETKLCDELGHLFAKKFMEHVENSAI